MHTILLGRQIGAPKRTADESSRQFPSEQPTIRELIDSGNTTPFFVLYASQAVRRAFATAINRHQAIYSSWLF